ncbi:MAG: DUF2975 domain-containing protein [Methanomassiliicoccaceae archaeon]|nr:DUF2975 domain-containing protein [Methanomassiliicoccaceae archaeon]
MSETLDKLTKISRIVAVVTKIFMIICVIALIAVIVMVIQVAINPDLFSNIADFPFTSNQLIAMGITSISGFVLGVIVLFHAHRFFTNVYKNNTPFLEDNVLCLNWIAKLMVIGAIALPIISAVVSYALDVGYETVVNFDLFVVFAALFVYFLALIFKHGVELQRASDETL